MEQSIQFPDKNFENIFASLMTMIKAVQIPYEYFYDEKYADFYAMTDLFSSWGSGKTPAAAIDNLVAALRIWTDIYIKDFSRWYSYHPEEIFYIVKILSSTDDEIKSCLVGKPCEDI